MSSEPLGNEQYQTRTGIPIRNIWYMLLYVWNYTYIFDRFNSEIETAPTIDALLAKILALQVQQRLRIGLGKDYRTETRVVTGIRGRIDFNKSLKGMTFPSGKTFSKYQIFQSNVPKNQIVRSTLARTLKIGDFGPNSVTAKQLRNKLSKLILELEGVDNIELNRDVIQRERVKRQDDDYGLMLSICHLLFTRQMPGEMDGTDYLSKIDRDTLLLYDIYEKFIAAFFKYHLSDWYVGPQQVVRWPTEISSEFLPVMKPDLTLKHCQTGAIIVIDTKFTKSSLVTGQWKNITFNRDHLFQIYAYLRSQENVSQEHQNSTGILLYPTVNNKLTEKVSIQGHNILWISIDLGKPWRDIEHELLSIPDNI